jgi:hypothetical protein
MDWPLGLTVGLITIALILYTIGFVLSRQRKYPNSFWFFLIGWFPFDLVGTIRMYNTVDKLIINWHTIPGMIGFVLMATAATMALVQLIKYRDGLMKWFKPIECWGYIIWLISYIIGALIRIF